MAELSSLTNEHPHVSTVEERERADWDICLRTPPLRHQGTIQVKLKATGRGKPMPVPDPSAEG